MLLRRFCILCFVVCCYLFFYSPKGFCQEIEGAWIGYIIDLSQLKDDDLPNIYNVKMVLQKQKEGNYKGIISRYWKNYRNTISSVSATVDTKSKMLSLTENENIKSGSIWNQLEGCKILSSLSMSTEKGKMVLEGKYYGANKNSVTQQCPIGKIRFERPSKDTSSFVYLTQFLDKKYASPSENLDNIDASVAQTSDNLFFHFPYIVVSSSSYALLQKKLHYDIYQLANSQKTQRTKKAIIVEDEQISLLIKNTNVYGDTVNVLFDGITLSTNYRLTASSPLKLDINFGDLIDNKINEYAYIFSVVPFSWTIKENNVIIDLINKKGEVLRSYNYAFTSNQNLEIPLIFRKK